MPVDLGRRLIASGVVPPEEVEAALFLSIVRGVPFTRALVDRGTLSERGLEDELGRRGGLALRNVVGVADLMARLPRAMCRRLCAVPVRLDPYTGTVDVAAADPLDGHIGREFGFHLAAPIRIIRAPMTAIEEAIRRVELDDTSPTVARHRRATPAFPHGTPLSSVPPPPVEDVPIPLVRRLGVPLIDPETEEPQTRRRGLESEVPPGADGAAAARKPLKTLKSERPTPVEGTRAQRGAIRDLPEEPPSVSFPSSPPPPPDDEPSAQTVRRGSGAVRPEIHAHIPPPPRSPDLARTSPSVVAGPVTRSFEIDDEPTHVLAARQEASAAARRPAPATKLGLGPVVAEAIQAEAASAANAAPPGAPLTAAPAGAEAPAAPPAPASPTPPRAIAAFEAREAPAGAPPPLVAAPAPADGPPPLPFADPATVLRALREATSRDEVVKQALRGMRQVARRIAVFVVKRDGFHGWACNVEFGDVEALRGVSIAHDQPSVLATATATSIYLGPIPPTPAHAALLAVMGAAGPDVAAIAVRAAGRPAMVLLADELGDTLTGTRRMDELARAIGEALGRLLVARPSGQGS